MSSVALDADVDDPELGPWTEPLMLAVAVALGAREVAGWSAEEEALAATLPAVSRARVAAVRTRVLHGGDPLGEAFCRLRAPAERRGRGATYTPLPIVDTMVGWALAAGEPARVVDPGVGSARFLLAAGRATTACRLVGVEIDPVAAIVARGNLAAAGLARRAEVHLADYRDVALEQVDGRTLFVGNPPYVRHHLIAPEWKAWLSERARALGLPASQLAGLHVHFFLATLAHARPGDTGMLITAAEWLDVNYGALLRGLLAGALGLERLVLIEPTAAPFPDAATTAVITAFQVGARPRTVTLQRVGSSAELARPEGARAVMRERLAVEPRWSPLTRPTRQVPADFVELGELVRVHRGQVTGANRVWIAGPHSAELPGHVLYPTITRARELFEAGATLADARALKRVIDLPVDLDELARDERRAVERFLQRARAAGAHHSYIARHRKAWWAVGLRQPAPILATYMARRPPAFVRNVAGARHINVAHGLYPREELGEPVLRALAAYLARAATLDDGRTYAGGLTKFEPREMERILVPSPRLLETEYRC